VTGEPVSVEGAAATVDTTGLLCPVPIIELAKHIDDVPVGATVAVLADDPAAAADVPAWCRMRGHGYVGAAAVSPTVTAYLVRRER
jgi:tRNA 2-thiouridine synthesizing protein A